jgi:hypothetical protein
MTQQRHPKRSDDVASQRATSITHFSTGQGTRNKEHGLFNNGITLAQRILEAGHQTLDVCSRRFWIELGSFLRKKLTPIKNY